MNTPVKLDRKGTVRNRYLWDEMVNNRFNGDQPVLSADESKKAALRLYRFAMKKPWTGVVNITSGTRHTWFRDRALWVNPDHRQRDVRGLRAIIHSLSHWCHRRLHPNDAPHSIRQARLERDMARYAVEHGFLDGKLLPKPKVEKPAPEPVKIDPVRQRYQRMVTRRDKWAAELERAKRLHVKAVRETRAYERRHGARLS